MATLDQFQWTRWTWPAEWNLQLPWGEQLYFELLCVPQSQVPRFLRELSASTTAMSPDIDAAKLALHSRLEAMQAGTEDGDEASKAIQTATDETLEQLMVIAEQATQAQVAKIAERVRGPFGVVDDKGQELLPDTAEFLASMTSNDLLVLLDKLKTGVSPGEARPFAQPSGD